MRPYRDSSTNANFHIEIRVGNVYTIPEKEVISLKQLKLLHYLQKGARKQATER